MTNFDFNAQAGIPSHTSFRGEPLTSRLQHLQDELSQLQAERKPLKITVGTELEMIVAHCKYPEGASGQMVATNTGRQAIYQLLNQPLSATCATCGELHMFKLAISRPGGEYDESYNTWSIDSDCTIQLTEDELDSIGDNVNHFDFYRVEIRTRILHVDRPQSTTQSLTDPQHTHSVSYAEEISRVLHRLNTGFDGKSELPGISGPFSVLTNQSCGLHVHVGNEHRGFPLRTVKNVVSTYVANERAIDAMHATDRIGGSRLPLEPQNRNQGLYRGTNEIEGNAYNMPWSAHHSMAVYDRREKASRGTDSPEFRTFAMANDSDPASQFYPVSHFSNPAVHKAATQYSAEAQLTLIQNAPSVPALQGHQGGYGHNSTVELSNLAPPGNPFHRKNTIEFRQHAGTTQPIEVLSWLDFAINVVRHAHNTPDEEYANLCTGEFRDPSYHTLDLLKAVGCSDRTLKHEKHKLGMGSHHYANTLADKEKANVPMTLPGMLLAPLQLHIIERRRNANIPTRVSARINTKFLQGGYGQFTDFYLDKLHFIGAQHAAAREGLRVGYVNPDTRPASSKEDESPYGHWGRLVRPVDDDEESEAQGHGTFSARSASSSEMAAYPLSDNEILFGIQRSSRAGRRASLTGATFGDYHESAGVADDDDVAQHIEDVNEPAQRVMLPPTENERAAIHPDRLQLIEAATAQQADSVQAPQVPDAIGHIWRTNAAAPRARPLPPDIVSTTTRNRDSDDGAPLSPGFRLQPPPRDTRRELRAARVHDSSAR
ncbi:hypothetical protein LTR36_007751 [Oleoguttula mirabilis]|uniref:Uncharacterized protein n=1 Tax=Oleoguttula mirabilis TaxID=1507867 RepID=A0AAV9JW99_9PEZI|nr:hypothetical protein LTR36_007751 [Oleoguttula mirabilis]